MSSQHGSPILALVHSWLVIDFFGDSRKTGAPGSSLTTTIFSQSFIGLVFAIVVMPDPPYTNQVAYLAANLSLSTLMVGIGLLGDPHRYKRTFADELLVRTSPVSAGSLTLARALYGSFYLCLVTIGMALPPAILAFWVCGHQLLMVPLYLVLACLAAGIMSGCLAVFTRLVLITLGPARAQLLVGTLKAILLGGGFLLLVICLRHLEGSAADIPFGPHSAWAWPPYWAARFMHSPTAGAPFLLGILGSCAVLYLASLATQRAALNRMASRPARDGVLARLDRWLAGGGAMLGTTAFISKMLYRSPGFRARVLPLFGLPVAMVLLSFMEEGESQARRLLLGVTLQFPAIFLPFLVAFMPRSDHERAGWLFETSPAVTPRMFRAASLISLTSHVILPIHAVALVTMLLVGELPAQDTIGLSMFSLGLAILVAWQSVQSLVHMPFTVDEDNESDQHALGGLMGIGIVLALLGGAYALLVQGLTASLVAAASVVLAMTAVRAARRGAIAGGNPS